MTTRIIRVRFPNSHTSQTYAYYTDIEGIVEGDVVVVNAPSDGMTCVKVVSVEEDVDGIKKANKWIVCKVDVAAYEARKEAEQRKELLKAKLEKMKKEALERQTYDMLLTMMPEAAEIIEELKKLGN